MPKAELEHLSRWRVRGRKWIERCLKYTHYHFLFFLPARKGLVSWLLDRFFTGIVMDREHTNILRTLPQDAILVYSIKFKSYFDFLFYHSRYQKEKLPVPELAFGYRFWLLQPVSRILRCCLAHLDWWVTHRGVLNPYAAGYWESELNAGRAALLPLIEKHGFYRRFVKAKPDPLLFLIELQQRTSRPVFIVPHLVFFSKSPAPAIPRLRDFIFGSEQRPGLIRRLLILFRQPGKVFAEISMPVDLKAFIAKTEVQSRTPEYQALLLRRQLLWQHNRHRQSITGPVIKSHEEIKESILASDRLQQFMTQYSESRKEPLYKVRKQAAEYLDEIAAKYSFTFIKIIAGPVGWLLNLMFDGTVVDKTGIQQLKLLSQKGPVILIPCHKSHVDYLILSYLLFVNNMPCPHVAAGKNLSFWPMGPIFRSGGAFFLRRTFKGAILYSKVFGEYIHKLLEDGFNIELFIEGGRSRTGKLLMPKLGFLTILLNAYKNNACEDLTFVPIFIGYDQVLEEHAYLHEIEGGKKEPENLSQVLRARRFLKSRYGKIYINFQEPISLNQLLQDYGVSFNELPQKEQNALCRDLGWRVINAIDRASVVTPHAIVAAALLNCPQKRFTKDDLFDIIDTYLNYIQTLEAKMADTMLMDQQGACEQALDSYLQRKLLELPGGEKDMPSEIAQYALPAGKRLQLEYYKNNCVSHFVSAAFTALAILEKDAFQFAASDIHDRYHYLRDLFKYEFAFNLDKPGEYFVRKTIKAFIDEAMLMPHPTMPDTYQITSAGLRKLKLFARFLKTYFESYWVVLNHLKQTPRDESSSKDRMKKIQSLGRAMHKRQEIEQDESLSKINYANGLSFFTTHGIKGHEDAEAIEGYEKTIRQFIGIIG
jgi:glycerol-3-phosphate O-acyltransferase